MKGLPHWHFSQKYAAKKLIVVGVIFLLLSMLGFFIPFTKTQANYFGFLSFIVGIGYVIYKTERAIKNKFP